MRQWDKDPMIRVYSKNGILTLTLAFFGIMYLINLVAYSVGNLIR